MSYAFVAEFPDEEEFVKQGCWKIPLSGSEGTPTELAETTVICQEERRVPLVAVAVLVISAPAYTEIVAVEPTARDELRENTPEIEILAEPFVAAA